MATKAELALGAEYVRGRFEDRDGVLYWRSTERKNLAGKPAGTPHPTKGYVKVNFTQPGARFHLMAHRVIWMLHKGVWPIGVIDHINRDPRDNRMENLRDVEHAVNNSNSPHRNVHPNVERGLLRGYRARVKISDGNVYLGTFETEEAAVQHRAMVCAELRKLAHSLAKVSWRHPQSEAASLEMAVSAPQGISGGGREE